MPTHENADANGDENLTLSECSLYSSTDPSRCVTEG
jgi:hypothetical protein